MTIMVCKNPNCGKPFVPGWAQLRRGWGFCSGSCRSGLQKRSALMVCKNPNCGRSFVPSLVQQKRGRGFCSRSCWHLARTRRGTERQCARCDNMFYVHPSDVTKKYCSRHCSDVSHITGFNQRCVCGNWFVLHPRGIKKYCSRECSTESQRGVENQAIIKGRAAYDALRTLLGDDETLNKVCGNFTFARWAAARHIMKNLHRVEKADILTLMLIPMIRNKGISE